MTPAAHPSEGDSESYIPGCSQNPFTFLSEPMTSPNMHPSPLFFEATGCGSHAAWCYGRDPSIDQPTVFYYQASLAGLGHQETNEPWSLPSVQHSKASVIHFTGERSSSRDENGLVGTEVGSLPCYEIGQYGFQVSDRPLALSNAEGALLLAKGSGVGWHRTDEADAVRR